ncbi:MAG: chromosome segregation protein SMC [Nanoarchaeota archaeon]|nr:chromosome segregation protein SMC [Nanoarchaeota archaeon]
MTYVKRIIISGFKSFARKTEIPFENAMNVIVGPNGSGKSNITDALCFVLGRLSIKSIRAAKAANLLFSGNKIYKGSVEASVELIFDNSDKTFGIDSKEIHIKRLVRKNGASIYKINNQTKTRQDLLELLAQAGIDPNGFNIILQGEIQSLVKASSEERRKIIEEVAGISIYETRKQKSLKELEKTEEKLKEVSSVLKERNSYLKNLDKERTDALNHKKLEEMIKKCKATLISKNVKEKEKDVLGIEKIIEDHTNEIEKIKKNTKDKNSEIDKLQEKIKIINAHIHSSTTDVQDVLHKELSNLKADLAGLNVRHENFESRILSSREKLEDNKDKIKKLNEEVSSIEVTSPKIKEHQKVQKEFQEKFDILEGERRKFYILKSDISTLESQKNEKEKFKIESNKEIQLINHNITELFNEIKFSKSIKSLEQARKETKESLEKSKIKIHDLENKVLKREKDRAIIEESILREKNLVGKITSLQNCPICKQIVGTEHKHKITSTSNKKMNFAKEELVINEKEKTAYKKELEIEKEREEKLNEKLNELEIDEIKLKNSNNLKNTIKRITNLIEESAIVLKNLNIKLHEKKEKFDKLKNIEEKYDETRLNLQELSFKDIDLDTKVQVKQREINRLNAELKSLSRDIEDSKVDSSKISAVIVEKTKLVEKKEIEEQKLYEKFQKLFGEKNELQDIQKAIETEVIGLMHTIKNFEDKINHNKISKAEINAMLDSLKTELREFGHIKVLNMPEEELKEKLQKSQFKISRLGNVNMRALEVFDQVKEQCVLIQEKVETIEKESEQIKKIITEIDKKKKKSFMETLVRVNEFFTRNFAQLSKKGEIFLELENKKDPFEGGLNILIRVSRAKYFDITSLSGGEKTMVALSLIFAIQEYRPYCFYIFDEIDAALDKHNSELLAALIKKYMVSGQYIIITHNDTLITEATNLYGVSMQENISKVISLKI